MESVAQKKMALNKIVIKGPPRGEIKCEHRTTHSGFVQGQDGCSCKIPENFMEYLFSYANLKFLDRQAGSGGGTI